MVATRRTTALLQTGAQMVVVAPEMHEELVKLDADHENLTLIQRAYQSNDLADAMLVVIATDDTMVNDQVCADARAARVLINRADMPQDGDLTIPAHAHHGPITLAVHTHGISAGASATIRRELSASLDPDWPRLLATVAPLRSVIIERFDDPAVRADLLRRMSSTEAMAALKAGREEAVVELIERMISETANTQPQTGSDHHA